MTNKPRMRARLVNLSIITIATIAVIALAEPLLRLRYVEPAVDRPVVREVQKWLVLDTDVGYTWRHDVTPGKNIRFDNADIEAPPLSTDEFGTINTPDAIAARRNGKPVDVLGLGDSFMEMAAPDFHRAFHDAGLSYYSLAVHRYSPAHYARMLEAHGFALRPKTILVGLFENDFAEIADFDAWQRSGLDWFEFHSGTWCGPPVRVTAFGRLIDGTFPGYQGLARVIRARVRGERMSISGPTDAQVSRVAEELQKIVDLASTNSAAVCLVLIPSKPTAQGDVTAEANAFDDLLDRLGKPTAGTIDLRPVFQAHPDPLSLYYQQDGHWNPDGVALAFQEIHKRLSAPPMTDES